MIFNNNPTIKFDSFCFLPLFCSTPMNEFVVKDCDINQLKINNGSTYDATIDSKGETISPAQPKDVLETASAGTKKELYDMMTNFDASQTGNTVVDAQFAGGLAAGNLDAKGDIEYYSIMRLGPEDNYRQYHEVGVIKNTLGNPSPSIEIKDYAIESYGVYFYSIRAITKEGLYGTILANKPALNTYEDDWLLCNDKNHTKIMVLDSKISSINHTTKDGVIETLGGQYPIVNRFSNLNYRTFTWTGTVAAQTDSFNYIGAAVNSEHEIPNGIKDRIRALFKNQLDAEPERFQNGMLTDLRQERLVKEEVFKLLRDGEPKILKTPTEGLMLVKLSKIVETPEEKLDRYVSHFSCTVTEVGPITDETIVQFGTFENYK